MPKFQLLACDVRTVKVICPPLDVAGAKHGSGVAPVAVVQAGTATPFRKMVTSLGSPGTADANSVKVRISGSEAVAGVAVMST
jgi:hypothetical protein